jgi:hypothetical protein
VPQLCSGAKRRSLPSNDNGTDSAIDLKVVECCHQFFIHQWRYGVSTPTVGQCHEGNTICKVANLNVNQITHLRHTLSVG